MRRIDVGVCTFRRPDLLRTALKSLVEQDLPDGVAFRVLVADNDEDRTAEPVVRDVAWTAPIEVVYLHAPARNISIARNACLDACEGEALAFSDDDAVASRTWLAELVAALDATGADAVFGPSLAVYRDTTPVWVKRGDYHTAKPVLVDGEIRTGYSGNVLMWREVFAERRFDPALGRSGGEDTDFFHRLWKAGGKLGSAPKAVVWEFVPPARTEFAWLFRRRFRSGQSHAGLFEDPRLSPKGVALAAMALVKMAVCAVGAALTAWSPTRSRSWILRGALHAGAFGRRLGGRPLELY